MGMWCEAVRSDGLVWWAGGLVWCELAGGHVV